ncbi:class I SAM-dependent methyltransferase [Streptomyces sp. NPDC088915]|uniref:class I SAM-dependent methyltransferase n=1 Tax=Streptomyces sp. NPDC088915 TaxID=3365912 RepID=UPI00381DB1F5
MIISPSMAHPLPDWDLLYQQGGLPQPISVGEVDRFRYYTGAAPGQVALDIGTGLGSFACRMAKIGLHVTGYDSSPTAIERARHFHTGHANERFETHNFDVGAAPPHLVPGSVDFVVCRHVLPFLDATRLITDIRRWLRRDNGVLHVTTSVSEKRPNGSKVHALSEAAVKELARGWASSRRYDLDPAGAVTAVVLRGPYG